MKLQFPFVSPEGLHSLRAWMENTGTELIQVNGQRKYGGPPKDWNGPTPGGHCEVFIRGIPRQIYEHVLIPLFGSVGPLWEFRLMMNFSGENRGFAFAKYASADVASGAILQLNGYVLKPGSILIVRHSIDKKHLLMENLPVTTEPGDLFQVLCAMTEGVKNVGLFTGHEQSTSALVTFASHHAAAMARRVLMEGSLCNDGGCEKCWLEYVGLDDLRLSSCCCNGSEGANGSIQEGFRIGHLSQLVGTAHEAKAEDNVAS